MSFWVAPIETWIARVMGGAFPFLIAFCPRFMPVTLIFAALCSAIYWLHKKRPSPPTPIAAIATPLLLIGLGLVYAAAGTAWSESPRAGEMLFDVLLMSGAALVLARTIHIYDEAFTDTFMRMMKLCFGIALALFTLNMLCNYPLQQMFSSYDGDYIGESNMPKRAEALMAVMVWPLAIYLRHKDYRSQARSLLLGTAILALGFASRTALLGIALGALVYLMGCRWPRLGPAVGAAVMPLGFVLMLAACLLIPLIPDSVRSALPATGEQRLLVWDYTAKETFNNWPLGIGFDGSRVHDRNLITWEPTHKVPAEFDVLPIHPHNIYLQVWLELGLVGAVIGSALLYILWHTIRRMEAHLQPFMWGYVITTVVTLSIAYGAWQAWWIAGHVQAALLIAHGLRQPKG